jgi:hypothetical protein
MIWYGVDVDHVHELFINTLKKLDSFESLNNIKFLSNEAECVDTIVSTDLYIDYYSIIWINYYLCFRSTRGKDDMATQRRPTRRASRVAATQQAWSSCHYYSRI